MNKNFVEILNDAILSFVSLPENARLKRGTGSFSTPFRGTLFGESTSSAVDAISKHTACSALWMGSNPNSPQSMEAIFDPAGQASTFDTFLKQRATGHYAEQGWDPINMPRAGWRTYCRLLSVLGGVKQVAMANFFVWGSPNLNALLLRMEAEDPALLRRALKFSRWLNAEIVRLLRPAVIVVPFSLGKNPVLRRLGATDLSLSPSCRAHRVTGTKREFSFYIDEAPPLLPGGRILHVPHPASLRFDGSSEELALAAMVEALGGRRPA